MTTPSRPTAVDIIQCDVCMREIPLSEATNAEVQDYVMHFCGLECYDQWRKQDVPEDQGKKPK